MFTEEPALAFHPSTPTGLIPCDLSMELDCQGPATSPLMLVYYARIAPSAALETEFAASGSVWYVMAGSGTSGQGSETICWAEGDVFVLPGGKHQHRAAKGGAVLWLVTDQPLFEFSGVTAGATQWQASAEIVHYPAIEIRRQFDSLMQTAGAGGPVPALVLSAAARESHAAATPCLSADITLLPPGQSLHLRPHNAVSVSLLIQGVQCHGTVGDRRRDWRTWATALTPPGVDHAIHNQGNSQAVWLTVHDAGLHRYTRTLNGA
jgi:gentisate 1,2-dioxygenase